MRGPELKLLDKPADLRLWLTALTVISAVYGGMASAAEPTASEPDAEPAGLMGEWCRIKKRKVTQYTVEEGKLRIRSGRSGRLYVADLTCNDDYTECKAKTIRGWQTPVTEILRLDGENMNLTRIWGGAWKDKTYDFTFTRCPKW